MLEGKRLQRQSNSVQPPPGFQDRQWGPIRSTLDSQCFVFLLRLAKYVKNGRRRHMASGQHLVSGTTGTQKYMYGFMLHSRRAVLKSVFPPSALPSSDLHWINGCAIEDARWLTRHIFARPDVDPDQACHVDRVRNENGCKKLCVVHPMDWADIRASWSEVGGLNITNLTRLHPIPRGTSDNTVLC